MKLVGILLINLLFNSGLLLADTTVYNFNNSQYESIKELTLKLSSKAHYVLGEYHYNKKIQDSQTEFISEMVSTHKAQGAFDVNWEFLNYKSNKLIQSKFNEFKRGTISVADFLGTFIQSQTNAYHSILNVTKKLNGNFYGVNASRKIKSQIIKKGLSSLNINDIPPNMKLGSANYFDRFREVMEGHVTEEELKAYYIAQCYTDSVMSYYMTDFSKNPLAFLVVGSFHSDYGLGTTKSLKDLGRTDIINLKFVDKSLLTQVELSKLLKPRRKLGRVADYLVLID